MISTERASACHRRRLPIATAITVVLLAAAAAASAQELPPGAVAGFLLERSRYTTVKVPDARAELIPTTSTTAARSSASLLSLHAETSASSGTGAGGSPPSAFRVLPAPSRSR